VTIKSFLPADRREESSAIIAGSAGVYMSAIVSSTSARISRTARFQVMLGVLLISNSIRHLLTFKNLGNMQSELIEYAFNRML